LLKERNKIRELGKEISWTIKVLLGKSRKKNIPVFNTSKLGVNNRGLNRPIS